MVRKMGISLSPLPNPLARESTDSAAAKAKGFLSGMAAAGLDADGHILETGETLEDGIRAVQQLLADGIRPDGILCGEDLTAAGVLKALLRAGIRVPEETAVVGYDNSTYARLCEPELTTNRSRWPYSASSCCRAASSTARTILLSPCSRNSFRGRAVEV